jgi:CRISPR-associated protein Cas5t
MKALRVEVKAITASFRYPMFAVSFQPTYRIPPISTVYGLLSAAKGSKVNIYDVSVGYDFVSRGYGIDLERILKYGDKSINRPASYVGSDIVRREFLFDCTLNLYVSDEKFKEYLKQPHFTLVLGRQSDLAMITKIDEVDLTPREGVEVSNTIIPFNGKVPGQVIALPSDFTDEAERRPLEVRTYLILETRQTIEKGYYDEELKKGVYMHEFNHKGKE